MDSTNGLHPTLEWAFKNMVAPSDPIPENISRVRGYDFNEGVNYDKLFQTLPNIGFQASHLGQAIHMINNMLTSRFKPVPQADKSSVHRSHISEGRRTTNCTIMLGYTSNMVTSGNREVIRYLVQHNMVDCIVTTAGGVEEDMMKCLYPFYMGDFSVKDKELNSRKHNRTGNILVPNNNYVFLHEWLHPILNVMVQEQNSGTNWTPSKMIWRLGKSIDHPDSIYYWAQRNQIPVFCPALTDGALGDVLYHHRHKFRGNSLRLDIVEDIQRINDMAVFSINTGAVILGSGLVKHHILNANCSRGGLDFAVYVNTSAEFDGSDSGASPQEAVSWGKIKNTSSAVKVFADATIVFPVLVGETFAKRESEIKAFNSKQQET